MREMKASVLDEICNWADGMSMDRIKKRKQPPASVEIQIEGQGEMPDKGSIADAIEQKMKGGSAPMEEGELSLEDLLKLEKEYK